MIIDNLVTDDYQLVYISKRCKDANDDIIVNIKAQAEQNNQRRNITGALIFTEHYFLQYLEGEKVKIDELYATICNDPRHENIRLLLRKPIKKRDFSRWSLGVKKLLDIEEHKDLLHLINQLGQASSITETHLDWLKLALK